MECHLSCTYQANSNGNPSKSFLNPLAVQAWKGISVRDDPADGISSKFPKAVTNKRPFGDLQPANKIHVDEAP